MDRAVIPEAAIKAGWLASLRNDLDSEDIIRILEAAAPYMLAPDHHDDEELAAAWDAGHTAGLRREFEVMAHIRAGEPSPAATPNPYGTTK